jgi:hypothetical protein
VRPATQIRVVGPFHKRISKIGYQNTATPPRPPTTDVSKPRPIAPCPWTW